MKLLLIPILLLSLSGMAQTPVNYPTIQSYISNSKSCISINVVKNGSGAVNIKAISSPLSPSFNVKKLVRSEMDRLYNRIVDYLKTAESSMEPKTVVKAQVQAFQSIDTLIQSTYFSDSSKQAIAHSNMVALVQASALNCLDTLAVVQLGNDLFYYTPKGGLGKEDIMVYETINKNNRLAFKFRNKFGFIDSAGRVVIEPKYDTVYPFSEGLAYAERENVGRWFIDTKDSVVIDLSYESFQSVNSFSDSVAMVTFSSDDDNCFKPGVNYINREGQLISQSNFYKGYDFSHSLGCVAVLIPEHSYFESVINMSQEEIKRTWLPLNNKQKEQIENVFYTYNFCRRFLKELQNDNNTANIYKKKISKVLPMNLGELARHWSAADPEKENFFAQSFYLNRLVKKMPVIDTICNYRLLYGYIDSKGIFKIEPFYSVALPFDNPNTARVGIISDKEERYSSFLINRKGGLKKGGVVEYLWHYDNYPYLGPALTSFDERYGFSNHIVMDTSGSVLVNIPEIDFIDMQDKFVIYRNSNKQYGLINVYGLIILEGRFTALEFVSPKMIKGITTLGKVDYYLIDKSDIAIKLEKTDNNKSE